MAILGKLIKGGIKLRKQISIQRKSPVESQKRVLLKLLKSAKETSFGRFNGFSEILKSENIISDFQKRVPVCNYSSIFNQWWHRSLGGEENVCWKGKVKYFALSSGTSEAASKHIPVTKEMIRQIQKTSVRQIISLADYDLSEEYFTKGILMLGGSTHLKKRGGFFEGDLSGITASQIPLWFQHFYKPGKKIAKEREWGAKLEEITKNATKWDIGIIVGVPAWIQLMMEKIIAHYKVKTIHDIWHNLKIFTHGGVSFEPYKNGFEKLLGKPLIYIETYLASEGFIAYQAEPNSRSMKLVTNNGIFFEFIPFNSENFLANGEMQEHPQTLLLNEIEEEKEYAILLSTCAGAWRYLIGDVIKFTSKEKCEIVITGRTKHFLSLCGEHLSVENMNKAIELVSHELNITTKEFTVAGIPFQNMFAHRWYVGTDDKVDEKKFKEKLDEKLKDLNDDYRTERISALKDIFVEIIPSEYFYKWLKQKGKEGAQNKFPRVMKKEQFEEWEQFVKSI